jgi:hypothetical protein
MPKKGFVFGFGVWFFFLWVWGLRRRERLALAEDGAEGGEELLDGVDLVVQLLPLGVLRSHLVVRAGLTLVDGVLAVLEARTEETEAVGGHLVQREGLDGRPCRSLCGGGAKREAHLERQRARRRAVPEEAADPSAVGAGHQRHRGGRRALALRNRLCRPERHRGGRATARVVCAARAGAALGVNEEPHAAAAVDGVRQARQGQREDRGRRSKRSHFVCVGLLRECTALSRGHLFNFTPP